MRIKFLILTLILSIFLINFVSAICTVTFDKESYVLTETVTADMICTGSEEKGDPYTLNWTYENGTQVELDTGTTPLTVGEHFYETYIILSGWPLGVFINATLQGTQLEGTVSANVTSASSSELIITSIQFTSADEIFIGRVLGVEFTIKDESAKKISNAQCTAAIEDGNGFPIVVSKQLRTNDGTGDTDFILDANSFSEDRDYELFIHCYCGAATTSNSCINENGTEVSNSVGSAANFFTINKYLNVNTVVDKTIYNMKEEIFVCSNVSNPIDAKRIPLKIYHQIRCSADSDNDGDLDRVVIVSDLDMPDERGINTNSTQMQCKRFILPEPRYLQGRNSECYASTSVWVLDDKKNPLMGYTTTSPVFNISSNELNLNPDWERTANYTFNTIINLSADKYREYNGTGTGNIDLRISRSSESINSYHQESRSQISISEFLATENIKSITIVNSTGGIVSYGLEFLDDGFLEIELRDVDISQSGWYNVTLEFNSFSERKTDALEGIETKTGTFHLDINCPSSGTIGSDMVCIITAYVEDSQTVQKEVDFTCYISDGTSTYSSTNFNQMITQNAVSLSRTFAIPSAFNSGTQYVLQCHADYYNLGSRRDSFYDTFTTSSSSDGGSSGVITGGAVDEGDEDKDRDIGEFNPFSPKRNWAFIFIEIIILIGIVSLICFFVKKKKRESHHYPHHHKSNWKEVIKKVFAGIIILLLVSLLGAGIWYGYGTIKNSLSEKSTIEQTTISEIGETSYLLLDGNLIKSIFLIFLAVLIISLIIIIFTTVLILVIFKLLNLRGEIKFGQNHFTKGFYEDKKSAKMQQKLNHMILKNEIKRKTLKENYKVRKMTPKEFVEFVKRKELVK